MLVVLEAKVFPCRPDVATAEDSPCFSWGRGNVLPRIFFIPRSGMFIVSYGRRLVDLFREILVGLLVYTLLLLLCYRDFLFVSIC